MTLARIQLRRGLAAQWTSINPILANGEAGVSTDEQELRVGDGVTHWSDLPVIGAGGGGGGGGGNNQTYSVGDYGAVGNGTADDAIPIKNALAAAKAAGGGTVELDKGKRYGWTGKIVVPNGVIFGGQSTRQNLAITAPPTAAGMVALSANAQLAVGDWATDSAPSGVRNLYVDGNYIGGLTPSKKGLVRLAGVDLFVDNLFVSRSAGDGTVYDGVQNSTVVGCMSTLHVGVALVMDNGAGAVAFAGGYYGTSKGGLFTMRDTAGEGNLYPFGPTQNTYLGTIFEAYTAQGAPIAEPYPHHALISGTQNHFTNCNFTGGAQTTANATVLIDNSAIPLIPTTVTFENCLFWARIGCDAIRIVGSPWVTFLGLQNVSDDGTNHATSFICIDGGSPHISMQGEVNMNGDVRGQNLFRTINGGTLAGVFSWKDGGQFSRLRTTQVNSVRREGDTGHRQYIDRDGTIAWFDGAGGATQGYIRRGAGGTGLGVDYYTGTGGQHNFLNGPIRVTDLYFGSDVTPFNPSAGGAVGLADSLPLRAYGNSYLAGTGNAMSIYFNRARRVLGSKTWDNRGVSGYLAGDNTWIAYDAIAVNHQGTAADEEGATSTVATHVPSAFPGGIYLLDTLRNDAGHDGQTYNSGTTAKSRAGAKNNLDALIRLIRAQSYVLATDASFTYSGTWLANAALAGVLGHSVKYTSTVASSVSIAATGTDFDLVLMGLDDAALGVVGSAFTITVDGSAFAPAGYPTTASNQTRRTTAGGPVKYTPLVIPIRGLSAGAHTIVVTQAGSAGQFLYVNALMVPSPTPPTILISKVNYLGAYGYSVYAALGGTGASTGVDDAYNAIIDSVVARFPADGSIQTIDQNALGFNTATMIGNSDGLGIHLNDLGNQFYANNLVKKIRALTARNGLVRI